MVSGAERRVRAIGRDKMEERDETMMEELGEQESTEISSCAVEMMHAVIQQQ